MQAKFGGVTWACLYGDFTTGPATSNVTFDGTVSFGHATPGLKQHLFDLTDDEAVVVSIVGNQNAPTAAPETAIQPTTTNPVMSLHHPTFGYSKRDVVVAGSISTDFNLSVGGTASLKNVAIGSGIFTPNVNSGNTGPKLEVFGGDIRLSGLGFLVFKDIIVAQNQTVTIPLSETAVSAGNITIEGTVNAGSNFGSLVII